MFLGHVAILWNEEEEEEDDDDEEEEEEKEEEEKEVLKLCLPVPREAPRRVHTMFAPSV